MPHDRVGVASSSSSSSSFSKNGLLVFRLFPMQTSSLLLCQDESEKTFLMQERAAWIEDQAAAACMNCQTMFSLLNRRHHCASCFFASLVFATTFRQRTRRNRKNIIGAGRSCGKIFCSTCSAQEIELPADYGYNGPQRVCVVCHPALLELQQQAQNLEMVAKFYLRGVNAAFAKSLPEIGSSLRARFVCLVRNGSAAAKRGAGWRSVFEKGFFLVKTASGEARVMELVRTPPRFVCCAPSSNGAAQIEASKTGLPLESDAKRQAFKALIGNFRHPFLYDPDTDVRRSGSFRRSPQPNPRWSSTFATKTSSSSCRASSSAAASKIASTTLCVPHAASLIVAPHPLTHHHPPSRRRCRNVTPPSTARAPSADRCRRLRPAPRCCAAALTVRRNTAPILDGTCSKRRDTPPRTGRSGRVAGSRVAVAHRDARASPASCCSRCTAAT